MKGVPCNRLKFHALTGEAVIGGARVLLMKPQTFMNLSGEAVGEAASFYKIPPENIIVAVDDVNLDVGRMRVRRGGSAGGHNGLKSIIAHLDSEAFPRIRVGVGKKPSPEYDLADWVLGKFTDSDREKLYGCFENILGAAELLIQNRSEEAMSRYNGTGAK
jgi:PTH1 family peptidyl-tRNA hydrolase